MRSHEELDKFHRFIINPNGDIEKGGEAPSIIDQQLEAERHQLLLEATKRDSVALAIPEEDDDLSSQEENFRREPCSLESSQEKTLQEEEKDYMMISQC